MLQLYANIKNRRIELGMTQSDLANKLGYADKSMIAKIESGKVDLSQSKIVAFADALNIKPSDLMGWEDISNNNIEPIKLSSSITIPVYGRVPAGVPIEAIESIDEYIDVPAEYAKGGKRLFGLKVKGDSMYPKYLDGDIIVVREESDCESGQDCVVYVNGYDATLKKVIKKQTTIILQPLNPEYEPIMYEYNDENHPVTIAGVVVEIRRKV
ncbi:LexA family protein [Gallibacter intestinalis]|uniref:LexA family transcriptional regulator n=1 Tax=Gallibacter intestinalis TaxID=2779356 RepID=A0ABR9QXB6_9FIRM|nr:LexA family transcriptional regulator [Gallibacter intestinalis]MBE5035527.1 LexA family transcriptional regulator [Gallibacter intestinalis]